MFVVTDLEDIFLPAMDGRRWQCNMCFTINDIPEKLCYDTNSMQHSDIHKINELTSMLRPPQPSEN